MHLGIAPAITLGTKLVVGAAHARSAGAAAGAAETGNELGGALGIALFGALGAVVYRAGMPVPGPAGDTLAGGGGPPPATPPAGARPRRRRVHDGRARHRGHERRDRAADRSPARRPAAARTGRSD